MEFWYIVLRSNGPWVDEWYSAKKGNWNPFSIAEYIVWINKWSVGRKDLLSSSRTCSHTSAIYCAIHSSPLVCNSAGTRDTSISKVSRSAKESGLMSPSDIISFMGSLAEADVAQEPQKAENTSLATARIFSRSRSLVRLMHKLNYSIRHIHCEFPRTCALLKTSWKWSSLPPDLTREEYKARKTVLVAYSRFEVDSVTWMMEVGTPCQ